MFRCYPSDVICRGPVTDTRDIEASAICHVRIEESQLGLPVATGGLQREKGEEKIPRSRARGPGSWSDISSTAKHSLEWPTQKPLSPERVYASTQEGG